MIKKISRAILQNATFIRARGKTFRAARTEIEMFAEARTASARGARKVGDKTRSLLSFVEAIADGERERAREERVLASLANFVLLSLSILRAIVRGRRRHFAERICS